MHSIKNKETRGGKSFPAKASRDVGMVDSVSDATSSSMEKPFITDIQLKYNL